jgi:Tol biopolymer transport system component
LYRSADASTYQQIFVRNLKTSTTRLASANSAGTNGGDKNACHWTPDTVC